MLTFLVFPLQVEAVQRCGGQKTADGKRFRMGGGILWNILKTREPKVYKEIMAKGKEFEVHMIHGLLIAACSYLLRY